MGGAYELSWTRAATAAISLDGRRVRFRSVQGAAPVSLALVRRMVRAYAFSLRGVESLHATTIAKGTAAVALLGPSGAGKSTLAAYLVRRGWHPLSDDVLWLKLRRDGVWPTRTLPWLKRVPAKGGISRGVVFDPNLGKEILIPGRTAGPRRVRAFVRLDRRPRGRVQVERLRGARAAAVLAVNVYNELLRPPRVRVAQLQWACRLAERVPVWRLRFPSGMVHLPRVAGTIQNILAGGPLRPGISP
ncbi:MAG: hypothetical protein HYY13_00250 [Nitrospirae bacterium]|nr:hypothetical protein [Nitrospirota bacterium]